jgi:hypothetical protein
MKARTTLEVTMPIHNDEIERRSRLILLVYEVLRDMEAPASEATNTAVLSALSRAFLDKATNLDKATVLDKATARPNREVAAPRERRNFEMFASPMS